MLPTAEVSNAHALIVDGKRGTRPSAAGVPPFEHAAWGFPAFLRYKERPARRESSLKTRTCRRALRLWAGRADAPMLPPNDICAEASQIADVVIRWALELYEYKIPLAEWRPLPW